MKLFISQTLHIVIAKTDRLVLLRDHLLQDSSLDYFQSVHFVQFFGCINAVKKSFEECC